MSEFACDYKIYKFESEDSIKNKLFNQDARFIADLPPSVVKDNAKLREWVLSNIRDTDDIYGEYVVVEIEANPYVPEGGRIREPIKMVYYREKDEYGDNTILIDSVDHNHQQKWATYLMPKGLSAKLNFLRILFPGEEIDEENFELYLESLRSQPVDIAKNLDILA